MKQVLIIGSGLSGLSCALKCAEKGIHVRLVSPFPSERAQSVMAAGGINAVLDDGMGGDSIQCHIEDTLKGGVGLSGQRAVSGLCHAAPGIIHWLEEMGTVFTRDSSGQVSRRAFGAQTYPRTCYCGASTGKQIMSALIMACRKQEAAGLIERSLWTDFYAGLIQDGQCYGALLFNEATSALETVYADAVVMATGGQNALFGKTTGSTVCDGYAEGKLFLQGADLKNLEFIQYHPTTMETPQKKMLISEAVRGEGGRLFYENEGHRVYFMEEKFGPKGNLMPRDVASRCIDELHRPVFLDVSFLGKEVIDRRLPEVRDLCLEYGGLDITKEPIPVTPSVHFFMGGLAVNLRHETSIRNLFAVGECASMYHGANRLGGNSLLAAIYSGQIAAEEISGRSQGVAKDFSSFAEQENANMNKSAETESKFAVMHIRDVIAESMWEKLGIVRDEKTLSDGISDLSYYLSIAGKINYDRSVLAYFNYSLTGILTLAKATLICAKERRESRGAHFRKDYPDTEQGMNAATLISYADGAYSVRYDREGQYES